MLRIAALALVLPVPFAVPCAPTAPVRIQDSVAVAAALLPNPTVSVTIDPEAKDALGDALREVAASAGVHLLISKEVHKALVGGAELLQSAAELPPEESWHFLETVLVENDLLMILHRREEPRLASIASRSAGAVRGILKQGAYWVEAGELHLVDQHPAILVSTLVATPHLDARQLVNSLRGMMTDFSIQAMLPAGNTRSIVLTSLGDDVGKIAKVIAEMDAAEAQRLAELEQGADDVQGDD